VFIWAAPIPTRTLSADDVETHMHPILSSPTSGSESLQSVLVIIQHYYYAVVSNTLYYSVSIVQYSFTSPNHSSKIKIRFREAT
jgi:hypothetical protein